ncbi:TPA: DUF4041 domain-containing protein, partial [Edwardsiella piscicida]
MYLSVIFIFIMFAFAVAFAISLKKLKKVQMSELSKSRQLEKYSAIIDAEAEAKQLLATATAQADDTIEQAKNIALTLEREASALLTNAEVKVESMQTDIAKLRLSYAEKKAIYNELEKAISIYREDVEFSEMGMYQPHFDFDTSEEFKLAIKKNRDKQKELLRIKNRDGAIWCATDWSVHNSRAEGKKMTTRAINLTARAFNGECDAAIANCTFKNWSIMYDRIHAAF